MKEKFKKFLEESFNPLPFKKNKYLKNEDLDVAQWWLDRVFTKEEIEEMINGVNGWVTTLNGERYIKVSDIKDFLNKKIT